MIWKELFPWANQELVELNIQSPKVLDRNVLISKSGFKGIEGDSTLTVLDRNYYCSIDYCTFFRCSSLGCYQKAGCVHMRLTGYGSASITRTIGDSCQSSWEGNFGRLEVGKFGSIIVMMTSINKCSPDSSIDSYHSLRLKNWNQIAKNINSTRSFSVRHTCLSTVTPVYATVDFCNFADNQLRMTCLQEITGSANVRRVNYIGNRLGALYTKLEGIISVYREVEGMIVIISDCVLIKNTATYLVSVCKSDATMIGCYIQNRSFKESGANLIVVDSNVREPITMTLMAGPGKHADIPYGGGTRSGKPRSISTVVYLTIFLSEALNFI